jgi:chromosome segregation ATPase
MTTQRDLSISPMSRSFLDMAGLEADLEAALAEADSPLAELAALEQAAPPIGAHMATTLRGKLAAAANHPDPITLSQASARVRRVTDDIRKALDAARSWAAEVEESRAALVEALNADKAVQSARKALAAAHRGAQALTARLSELRASLTALSDRPADAASASAWAARRTALQGEIAAVEGLEADARRPIGPAQAALAEAEAAVLRRLQEDAAGEAQTTRQEWSAELERLNTEYRARVAAADRGAARMQTAQRVLKGA